MSLHRKPPTPVKAWRRLVDATRPVEAERVSLESTRGAYLAETLELPLAPGHATGPVCEINGYAAPVSFAGGAFRFECERLARERERRPHLPAEESDDDVPRLVRVDSGDPLPVGCDRVLPLQRAMVTGTGRAEVEPAAVPPAGSGVVEATQPTSTISPGVPLDARLRARLLDRGVHEVLARAPGRIGTATIGADLIDVTIGRGEAGDDREAGGSALRGDVTGYWLEETLRASGWQPRGFGIVPPEPAAVARLLRRMQRQSLGRAILVGGVGDGLADRTVEALMDGPFHIHFDRVALEPGGRFLYAHGLGLELFVLGGAPLDAACAFDVFVAPSLVSALGAVEREWDWTKIRVRVDAQEKEEIADAAAGKQDAGEVVTPWRAIPFFEAGPLSRFVPGTPDQKGWKLLPGEPPPPGAEAHFYQVSVSRAP